MTERPSSRRLKRGVRVLDEVSVTSQLKMRSVPVVAARVERQTWVARRVLVPLSRWLERWLFETGLVSAVTLLRWKVTPAKLRRKAMGIAGVPSERYHVDTERIDERLRGAIESLARVDEGRALGGCAVGGRDLRVGLTSILILERRLTRQLVASLHATAARSRTPAIDAAPVGSPLVIVGPPRSGTTLLLE